MIVYLIRNTVNGRCYVGKTTRSLHVRWREHKKEARLGRVVSVLYHEMRRMGAAAFEVSVLGETDSEARLNGMERRFIRQFKACEGGYNEECCAFGGRPRFERSGRKRRLPRAWRKKIAASVRASWVERRAAKGVA